MNAGTVTIDTSGMTSEEIAEYERYMSGVEGKPNPLLLFVGTALVAALVFISIQGGRHA